MMLKGRITYAHFLNLCDSNHPDFLPHFPHQLPLLHPLSVDRNVQLTSLIQGEVTLVQQVKFEGTRLVALRSCQQRMLPQ